MANLIIFDNFETKESIRPPSWDEIAAKDPKFGDIVMATGVYRQVYVVNNNNELLHIGETVFSATIPAEICGKFENPVEHYRCIAEEPILYLHLAPHQYHIANLEGEGDTLTCYDFFPVDSYDSDNHDYNGSLAG